MAYNNNFIPQQPKKGKTKNTGNNTTNSLFLNNPQAAKFLQIKFWNKTMGVDIGNYNPDEPLTPTVIQQAQRFGHVFGFSTLFDLKEVAEDILRSLRDTGNFQSTAVLAGQNHNVIVEFSNGNNIGLPNGLYLVIYKNFDPSKRTQTFEYYPFSTTTTLKGYDHNTGSYTEGTLSYSDFKKFVMCLEESAKAFTMAQGHVVQEMNQSKSATMLDQLIAISNALGIDPAPSMDNSNGYRSNGKSSYQRKGNNNGSFQRQSAPGQWNRGGSYYNKGNNGYNNNNGGNYTPRNPNLQPMQSNPQPNFQEPVNITLDANTLQQVSVGDLNG